MTTRLFLVRHGAVPANRERRFIGDRDQHLTDEGKQQIERLALELAPVSPAAILTSPLSRAQQTAERLARQSELAPRVDERLREQSFGEWEGRRFQDFSVTEAQRYFAKPDEAPPGGESLAAVRERVLALIHDLEVEQYRQPVYLVSHVGPIKILIAEALQVSIEVLKRLILDPGTLTVIDWGESPVVRVVNAGGLRPWPLG